MYHLNSEEKFTILLKFKIEYFTDVYETALGLATGNTTNCHFSILEYNVVVGKPYFKITALK